MYTGNSSLCLTCRSQKVSVVLISLVYNSVCGIQSTEINLYTFKDFSGVLKTITNTRREINVRENRRVNQVWKTQRTTLDTQDTGRRQTKHKKLKKWLHEVWIYRFFCCCKNPMLQNCLNIFQTNGRSHRINFRIHIRLNIEV